MSRRQNPNDFLKQIIGRPVVVKLNSGVDYRQGRICCKYMQMKTKDIHLVNFFSNSGFLLSYFVTIY